MDISYMSASELLKAFNERTVSPVEVMEHTIARIDSAEGQSVNAVAERLYEHGMDAARESERRYTRKGGDVRPLEGLPVAVKEEQPIRGRSWRLGSTFTEGNVATDTQPCVERLMAAGAAIHIRTTTPELSCAGFTHSELWGITRNPWNLDYGPGGSSGGSGAALAAGLAFLATGSDIAGSIRFPASFCGIVGYRPPYGRVPGLPPFNLDTYCSDGPMARTVADCALMQNVIAGPDRRDHASVPAVAPLPAELLPSSRLRVAVAFGIDGYDVDDEIIANTVGVVDALRAAGHSVSEVNLPVTRDDIMATAFAHYGIVLGPSFTQLAPLEHPSWAPYVKDIGVRIARAFAEVDPIVVVEREARIQQALSDVFVDYDALICPTAATIGFEAGNDYVSSDESYSGSHISQGLTPIFNIASRHPVLNVPSGRARNGVPTGVQIVARRFDDLTAFQLGATLERELQWWNDDQWRPETHSQQAAPTSSTTS